MSEEQLNEAGSVAEPATQGASRVNTVLAVAGWITAILPGGLPIALVLGGILASRDDRRGRWILGVAVAMLLFWIVTFLVLQNAVEDHSVRGYYYE